MWWGLPNFEISQWRKRTFHLVLLEVWARSASWAWKVQVLLWILQLSPAAETPEKKGTKYSQGLSLERERCRAMKHHLVLSASKGAVLYLRVFMFGLDVYIKYLCPCCTFFLLGEAGAEEMRKFLFAASKKTECLFQMKNSCHRSCWLVSPWLLCSLMAQGNLYKEIWLALEKHKREELAVGRGFWGLEEEFKRFVLRLLEIKVLVHSIPTFCCCQ